MKILFRLSLVALLLACTALPQRAVAQAQGASSAQSSSTPSEAGQDKHESIGQELAQEEREATGEAEEEHANLKHSTMVKKLAKLTGGNVHRAHLLALGLNFVFIVVIVVWFGRKFVPGLLRSRTQSIQHALEEARAASQDASRRLTEIENRLRQLDVEIGHMQANAEKEAEAEEARIKAVAEEDIRKVVQAAEQEIAAAAKLARRELTAHTADLAIALARQQITIDPDTDQALVRTFASKLSQNGKDGN